MVICPAHPKRDQNLKFTPETTSIPAPFIWESPPPRGAQCTGLWRPWIEARLGVTLFCYKPSCSSCANRVIHILTMLCYVNNVCYVNCGYQEKPSLKKARKHHLLPFSVLCSLVITSNDQFWKGTLTSIRNFKFMYKCERRGSECLTLLDIAFCVLFLI